MTDSMSSTSKCATVWPTFGCPRRTDAQILEHPAENAECADRDIDSGERQIVVRYAGVHLLLQEEPGIDIERVNAAANPETAPVRIRGAPTQRQQRTLRGCTGGCQFALDGKTGELSIAPRQRVAPRFADTAFKSQSQSFSRRFSCWHG